MRTLIIDDDPQLARSIGRMLCGHVVTVETDPHAALDRLRFGEWYDLILCDLNMPPVRGTEIIEQIRYRLGADAPMLVLMSGDDPILFSGADAQLSKPFDAQELRAVIDEVVALRERRHRAQTVVLRSYRGVA